MRLPHGIPLCLALATLPAVAASSPFTGTWKLDQGQSKLAGETYSYTRTPDGKLQYSNGADLKVLITTDGKQFPGPFPGTVGTWTQHGPRIADFVQMLNGKAVSHSHLVLSADGKTITTERTTTRPDGSTGHSTSVATRTAGGPGFDGTWHITATKLNSPDIFEVSLPSSDTLRMAVPAWKTSWQGRLDGTPAPFTGPQEIQGMTLAFKKTNALTLDGVTSVNGKPISYERDAVSADGKTWTITSWDAGKESEKTTYVYTH